MHVHHVQAILWFISIYRGIIALIPPPPLQLLCQAEVAAGRQTVGRFICSATPEGDLSYVLPSSSLSGLRFMHLFLTIKFVCLVSGRSGPVPWPCASYACSLAGAEAVLGIQGAAFYDRVNCMHALQ